MNFDNPFLLHRRIRELERAQETTRRERDEARIVARRLLKWAKTPRDTSELEDAYSWLIEAAAGAERP